MDPHRPFAALLALTLALAACGDDDDALSSTNSTAVAPAATASQIGFDALPPIVAGMTLREAEEAYGKSIEVQDDFEGMGGYCFHAIPKGLEDQVILLLLAPSEEPVTDPLDGIIGRASAYQDMADPLGTGRIQLGASEEDVRSAYAEHDIDESPHEYVASGSYLDVIPLDGDREHMIRFETDEAGTVTTIHGGLQDAARLIEGCA